MAKSIIQRLIDAGVCTHKDVEKYLDEYNKTQERLIKQHAEHASKEVKQTSTDYVADYVTNPIGAGLVGGKCVIRDGVKTICTRAFEGCESLKEIDLSNVEVIGAKAFLNCTNLRRVKFGKKLKVIDKYAFYGCENLEAIDLDIQGTKIHWTAFMHCPNWIEVSTILQAKSKAGEEIEWYH